MQLHKLIGGVILLTATSLVAAEPPKQDSVKKDLNEILGTWQVTAIETDGMAGPAEIVEKLTLNFKDDKLTFTPGEPRFTQYTFRLDPNTKPASFDMTHADGSKKGETKKGIYLLEGDRLKICFGNEDDRPKELTAEADSEQVMYTLRRKKP
jgi:uncharacterized protein (TIGR03067 family)